MKEIKTNGITILFVEVPEDAKEFEVHHNILYYPHEYDDADGTCLPIGQYQILGKSTELSEEQMKEIVEEHKDSTFVHPIYKDYVKDLRVTKGNGFTSIILGFDVPELSYLSLLEANGIVDKNNIPEPQGIGFYCPSQEWDEWHESQSKVKHYLVLKRI